MEEHEVVALIIKVAKKLAPKFVFASYDEDDIVQEAFIIGIDGLDKYDETRPLANFMFTHISNRLKNFKRDNYYRLDHGSGFDIQAKKKNILDAIDISNINSVWSKDNNLAILQHQEMLDIIDKQLPSEYRQDYLRVQQGVPIPKTSREKIFKIIQEIIELDPRSMHNDTEEEES